MSVPDWIWKILTTIMLAVILGMGSWLFAKVVASQIELAAMRVSMQAIIESSKLVDDQQNTHLTTLAHDAHRINEKLDALRDDIRKIKQTTP